MFTRFTKEEKATHYPADRRTCIGVKPYMWVVFASILLLPVAGAWMQYLIAGLPVDPTGPNVPLEHGAPLRLRIENQPGYKMVKWISSIDFVETHEIIGKGFGGKNEDDEYFDLLANT